MAEEEKIEPDQKVPKRPDIVEEWLKYGDLKPRNEEETPPPTDYEAWRKLK